MKVSKMLKLFVLFLVIMPFYVNAFTHEDLAMGKVKGKLWNEGIKSDTPVQNVYISKKKNPEELKLALEKILSSSI